MPELFATGSVEAELRLRRLGFDRVPRLDTVNGNGR